MTSCRRCHPFWFLILFLNFTCKCHSDDTAGVLEAQVILDVARHYLQIIMALTETERIMREVDRVAIE